MDIVEIDIRADAASSEDLRLIQAPLGSTWSKLLRPFEWTCLCIQLLTVARSGRRVRFGPRWLAASLACLAVRFGWQSE
jgi:hypothetical protein